MEFLTKTPRLRAASCMQPLVLNNSDYYNNTNSNSDIYNHTNNVHNGPRFIKMDQWPKLIRLIQKIVTAHWSGPSVFLYPLNEWNDRALKNINIFMSITITN